MVSSPGPVYDPDTDYDPDTENVWQLKDIHIFINNLNEYLGFSAIPGKTTPVFAQNNMNKRLYSYQGSLLHSVLGHPSYWLSCWFSTVVERERPMNLLGSIKENQNTIVQLYLKLEHRFSENTLIRGLWNTMAHDVSQQINSLNALPQSFWNQLKQDRDNPPIEAAEVIRHQDVGNEEDKSLRSCFESALRLEEPTILKVYVPLIRRLRENLTAPALDFYIMVKAHLARIVRVTESFSGDPLIIQRSSQLLQTFEKEVQEPSHVEVVVPARKKKKPQAAHVARQKEPVKKPRKVMQRSRVLQKRTTIIRARAKHLVKKVSIQRRRARR